MDFSYAMLMSGHVWQMLQGLWMRCCSVFDIEGGGGSMIKYHGPPKPIFLKVFMVNNLVF